MCERDEDGNLIDPVTYNIIESENLITFKQNNKVFCYDIDSLYRSNLGKMIAINPLNGQPLDISVVEKLMIYAETIHKNNLNLGNSQLQEDTYILDEYIDENIHSFHIRDEYIDENRYRPFIYPRIQMIDIIRNIQHPIIITGTPVINFDVNEILGLLTPNNK